MVAKKYVLEITPQSCYSPFRPWGTHTTNYNILWSDNAKDVALVVFTGGNDVDPALYQEKVGRHTDTPHAKRDAHEQRCFSRAKELGIPVAGICRGSQFLCVMSGGKLVQHITGHHEYHSIKTHDGKIIECNSTHHQMQLPTSEATILAMAEPRLSNQYLNGNDENIIDVVPGDVEVVYYPNINGLGIQYHPEWLNESHPCVEYCRQVVKEFLIK